MLVSSWQCVTCNATRCLSPFSRASKLAIRPVKSFQQSAQTTGYSLCRCRLDVTVIRMSRVHAALKRICRQITATSFVTSRSYSQEKSTLHAWFLNTISLPRNLRRKSFLTSLLPFTQICGAETHKVNQGCGRQGEVENACYFDAYAAHAIH